MSGSNLNILVANDRLDQIGGTESYTFALLQSLKNKGYLVEYFTFNRGLTSQKIENELNVYFKSREQYDIIFANHNTCVKELYNLGFIIQTCHGIFPKLEQPSNYADAFVSISEEVQEYLKEKGYNSEIILNGINLARFVPEHKVNNKIKTILSLSHSDEVNALLSSICIRNSLNLLVCNKYKNAVWNIEEQINKADLVVGLGRSAYDAMACGRPVLIFDRRGYVKEFYGDGYLQKENIANSIKNNCSGRYYKKKFDIKDLENEILKYNPEDGIFLRTFAEDNLSIDNAAESYLNLYKRQKASFRFRFKIFRNFYNNFLSFKKKIFYPYKVFVYNLVNKNLISKHKNIFL